MEKAAVSAPQLLGIDAPLNMEKEAASAPNLLGFEPFNLEEFLRLANAVIDKGDEKTIAALRDLKDRWKERFRSIPSLRSFVESRGAPSRVSKLRPALRCLLPSGMNSGESENALISSDSEKQSSAIGISAGNVTVLPATGERRVPQLADVAIVGDGDDELAVAVADDVEGDVTDDARMTSDDITDEITTDGITADAGMTASAVDVIDDVTLHKKTRKQLSNFSSFPTGLFVGNIPLHACSDTIINDKIAHAFHNSTRKTLSYVAPTMQNGEVIVRPTLDIIRNGSKRWRATAVGYFLGKRPYFYHLKEFAMSVWPDLKEVTGTNNGFFFWVNVNFINKE
ncbi:UNVERIFIED_CONTAM: hypothetical protein Sindi_2655800 [Sesamum indicum]